MDDEMTMRHHHHGQKNIIYRERKPLHGHTFRLISTLNFLRCKFLKILQLIVVFKISSSSWSSSFSSDTSIHSKDNEPVLEEENVVQDRVVEAQDIHLLVVGSMDSTEETSEETRKVLPLGSSGSSVMESVYSTPLLEDEAIVEESLH